MRSDEMIVRLLMDSNMLASAQLSITIAGDSVNDELKKIACEAVEQHNKTLEEVKEAAGYE